ncbi:MAG: DUF1015 domain-containing protein [Candidatus Bathyarchaeota archaeon]|nr:DUF1015 domain-containing protein [Candidatus Bathyarchaeota archaeon]
MVDIRPFKAIRYSKKAGSIIDLITQPYDKIDSLMQRSYYNKSIYNYCRLILPIENNKYEVAQKRIVEWMNNQILIKDKEPAIFVSRQEFQLGEKNCVRIGLIAAIYLYPYNENTVFPHEVTYKEPKTDRTKMLESLQKDLEPVFLIYSDPKKITINFFSRITQTPPLIDFKDSSGIKHTIWKISDFQSIEFVRDALKDKILVVADGHHRYESAIIYRDDRRKKEEWTKDSAYNFHMSYIVPVEEDGLVVLPTHRALKEFELTPTILNKLSEFFSLQIVDPTVESLDSFLKKNSQKHAFCVYNGTKAYGLLLKNETQASTIINNAKSKEAGLIDVIVLRDLVFKRVMGIGKLKMHQDILYAESIKVALEKVDSREAKLAFLVNPIDPKIVWRIAQNGWRLPEKSTDFYPKPYSGLTMMDISNGEKL